MVSKICLHWSASGYQPNNIDYEHYHYMINAQGLVIEGKYKPKDNNNCTDGKYAQHCGGGNTGACGVSLCGMLGFKSRYAVGKYPLTKVQCERAFKLCAELCKKYNIRITPQTVFTHYEFGKTHPKTSSAGKIDIIYLPPYPTISQDRVGDFIRSKIQWYYNKL